MSFSSPDFWIALLQIIGVNIVLSGDNAVVIALAARSLPAAQQKKAVAWGSGAAVVMRIVLTIVAVELLRLPYLKLVGAGLLLWIAVQLLLPEEEGGGHAEAASNLGSAIKTILLADLVMSLDNVIAVAAAAKGDLTLLIVGLAISIPMVIFASTLLLTLMSRFPVIIVIGAALLGWVAGEMAVGDPAVKDWIDANAAYLHYLAPALGAVGVVLVGQWLARRQRVEHLREEQVPVPAHVAKGFRCVLLAVDGSDSSAHAVRHFMTLRDDLREPASLRLHLVNVQRPMSGDVSTFIADETREAYHHEQADTALAPARAMLDAAGYQYEVHQPVGEPGPTIAELADRIGADLIVMGSRGLSGKTGALLGSVAQRALEHAAVPVLLAR
ncbi:MAG: YjbE family putative metal transport protein [Piscinibacter sp.]|nr:YjbE family putative metal transport protein [Piscinibacter sp.]